MPMFSSYMTRKHTHTPHAHTSQTLPHAHTSQTLPHAQAADLTKRSQLATPTSITEESEDQVDFDLKTKSWDRRHARPISPDDLVSKRTGSKVKGATNDSDQIKTDIEDKLTGAVNYSLNSSTTPRTDPLRRKAVTDSNLKSLQPVQPLTSPVSVIISASKKSDSVPNSPFHCFNGMENGSETLSVVRSTTSPNVDGGFKSTKYKDQDEPDVGVLTSYIAQMRARGHKRSTSAPVRPIKEKMGGVSSLVTTSERSGKGEETLTASMKVLS